MKDELENKNPSTEQLNEDDLWSMLSDVPAEEPKSAPAPQTAPKPSAAPRFEKKAAPAPARRIDGFFLACMAGVALVSILLTLLISSLFGGKGPAPQATDPVGTSAPVETVDPSAETAGSSAAQIQALEQKIAELEEENTELHNAVKQREDQIKELYRDYTELQEAAGIEPTGTVDPDGGNDILIEQDQANALFAQIQDAHNQLDRKKLEELIQKMDELLEYLSPEQLNEYYFILEYVEQPSNG